MGLLAKYAVPLEIVFEHRIFEDRDRAAGLECCGQPRGIGQECEFSVGIDADGVVGAGGLLHQLHCLDNIPRACLELVVAEAEAGADFGFGGGFARFHMARPVGDGYFVAHFGAEEAVQWDGVGLAGDVEQRAGEGIGMGVGIEGQRVLADEGVGCGLAGGFDALELAPTLQALVGLYPTEGDIVDFGKVAGDGRDGRDF